MKENLRVKKTDINILILTVFLTMLRSSIFWPLYPKTSTLFSTGWIEILMWVFLIALIFRLTKNDGSLNALKNYWRKETWLLLFLGFSFFSLFWSISFTDSLYRILILFFSSFAGAYIGLRYGVQGLINILFWVGAVIMALSFIFAFLFPETAISYGHPYFGAWRGIYWNRNLLGAIIALMNIVFFFHILLDFPEKKKTLLNIIFYTSSLFLVYLAKSATGYILVILLNSLVIVITLWLSLRHRLKATHYYAFLVLTIIGIITIFTNLDFLFGLLNRQPNLTGRVPMWKILINDVISHSPWVGYGFGAIWTIESFRGGIQSAAGWPYPILIGDNGFIDILMHIGIIGLIFFLCFWVLVWIRSFRYAFEKLNLLDFFPLVFMFFTLMANISFSLFLEVESFIWMILVALIFALSKYQLQTEY